MTNAPPDLKRESFEREALVHLDVLYRVALRLSGNAADADDLVQETMLKAYRAWDQYEKGTNAKGWLLTILRHAFINEYRRRTGTPRTWIWTPSSRLRCLGRYRMRTPRAPFSTRSS